MSEIIIKIKAPSKDAKNSIGGLADDVDRSFGGMEKSGTRLERSWRSLKSSWLKTAAVIGGSLIALKKGWDTAFNAARFAQMRQSFHTFAASHGVDSNVIIENLKRASAETIATAELMEAAGNAMLLGIPAEKLTKMMEIARASSRITGRTIAESFQDIALGMGRQSKLILDNLGIIVRVEKANKDYAATIGKLASELTDAEKKQAFFNAVMAAGEDTMRRVNVQAVTQIERMQRLQAQWKDAGVAIGGVFVRLGLAITVIFQSSAALFDRLLGYFFRFARQAALMTDALHITTGVSEALARAAEDAAGVSQELIEKAQESYEALLNYGKLEEPIKDVADALKDAKDQAAALEKESAKSIEAQISGYEDVQAALEKHLAAAKSAYKGHADEIIALEKQIARERMTSEELIRDLRQSLLGPAALRDDQRLQAEEAASKAREALAQKDFETASLYADKARSLYADLGTEVKDGEKIIVDQAAAVQEAVDGIAASEKLIEEILEAQISKADDARKALVEPIRDGEAALDDLLAKLQELKDSTTSHKVEIDDAAATTAIAALQKNTSSTHTVNVVEIQNKRTGGPILARAGRYLSGYGGGDKIPLMAEAGEYVIKKEAVRHYGRAVFDSLNRMSAGDLFSRMGAPGFAAGGMVPSGPGPGAGNTRKELGTVNLTLGGETYSLQAAENVFKGLSDRVGSIKASSGDYRPPWEN